MSTDSAISDVATLVLGTSTFSETENEAIFYTKNWTAERKPRGKPKAMQSFVHTTFKVHGQLQGIGDVLFIIGLVHLI